MNEEHLLSLKITLLGESSVGKTSIINQYVNKKYMETNLTTIGCDKFSRVVNIQNKDILLNFWDTAGQERFKSLSPMFLKGSNIVILVYDITNEASFNALENFWINIVRDNTENILLGIAANKNDLYENEKVNEEKVRKFAERENAIFACISAKDYLPIEVFFSQLTNLYISKNGFDFNLNEYSFLSKDLISQDNIPLKNINNNINNKNKKNCCK